MTFPQAQPRPSVGSLFSNAWAMFTRSAGSLIGWQVIIGVVASIVIAVVSVAGAFAFMDADDPTAQPPVAFTITISVIAVALLAFAMPILYNLIVKGLQGPVKFGEATQFAQGAYMASALWLVILMIVSSIPSIVLNGSTAPSSETELTDYATLSISTLSPAALGITAVFSLAIFFLSPFFNFAIYGLIAGHFNSVGAALRWNFSSPTVKKNYLWLLGVSVLASFVMTVGLFFCLVGGLVTFPVSMFVLAMVYGFLASSDSQMAQQQPPM